MYSPAVKMKGYTMEIDLDTIGYFLFMEEQEKKRNSQDEEEADEEDK